jgi:hypothetical protein
MKFSILDNINFPNKPCVLQITDKLLSPLRISLQGRTVTLSEGQKVIENKTYHMGIRILAGLGALLVLPLTLAALVIKCLYSTNVDQAIKDLDIEDPTNHEKGDDPFLTLPNELLTEIFSHVDGKDLGTLARVNHRFSDVQKTEAIWKNLALKMNIQQVTGLSYQESIKQALPFLSSINIEEKKIYLDPSIYWCKSADLKDSELLIEKILRFIKTNYSLNVFGCQHAGMSNFNYYYINTQDTFKVVFIDANIPIAKSSSEEKEFFDIIDQRNPHVPQIFSIIART